MNGVNLRQTIAHKVGYLGFLFLITTLAAQSDSNARRNLVLSALGQRSHQPANPFCNYVGCTVKHEVLGEYDTPYKTRKAKLVITASSEPHHDCHACGPLLSFFKFSERGGRWELTDSYFAVTEWGQFGYADRHGVTVRSLGDDFYGVFLTGGSANQGITESFTHIFAHLGDNYTEIAPIQTSEHDGATGSSNWTGTITVDTRPVRVHDLIVRASGVRDGQTFNTTQRYTFDGTEYGIAQ